ncbi:DUF4382 domain-containing protein [Candidatus Woesearchaeota archaeon]|nr:DUF4382 domain-containing protein [Candidatus Woesearchaeota archaeon]
MKQKILLIGLLVFLVAMNSFFVLAAAEEIKVKAGTTPGNVFYGLDRAMERIRLAFTGDDIKKAQLHLQYAEERLAELKEVVNKNKFKHVEKLVKYHKEELEDAQKEIDQAASKGKSVEAVAALVAQMTYKHIEVLEGVLEKVPEQAKEHIQHAIQMSMKGNQQAVESIEKQTGKPADVPKAKERPEKEAGKPEDVPREKPEEPEEGEGELVVQITDKPASINITKLEVTFSSVRVHASGSAAPNDEVCVEEEYEEEVCTNETIIIDENCTNITEEQEICINETFYNETCTEDECVNGTFVIEITCVNGTFVEESTCVNGTLINESCVNGTFVNETVCSGALVNETVCNGTFVPAGCINESYIVETCENETVLINQTCTNETTTTEEVCENVTLNRTVCTASENGNAGWKTVIDESKTFDLIELRDVKELLGNTTLAAGKYTQIRILVSSVNLEVDGEPATLKVPSNKIKLIKPFIISSGETTTLTLDFDAMKSVHQAGSKYIMKPTIKVIQE